MSTIEREFFRTQAEAGIQFAPWADNAQLQRAAGVAIGIIAVGVSAAVVMAFFAGLLRLLAGGA
jgi:hypothetical protein